MSVFLNSVWCRGEKDSAGVLLNCFGGKGESALRFHCELCSQIKCLPCIL